MAFNPGTDAMAPSGWAVSPFASIPAAAVGTPVDVRYTEGGSARAGSLTHPTGVCVDEEQQLIYVADFTDRSVLVYGADGEFHSRFTVCDDMPDMCPVKVAVTVMDVGRPVSILYVLMWKPASSAVSVISVVDTRTRREVARMLPPAEQSFFRVVSAPFADVFVLVTPKPGQPQVLHLHVYKPGAVVPHAAFPTDVPFDRSRGIGIQYDTDLDVIRIVYQATGEVFEIYPHGGTASRWEAGLPCIASLTLPGARTLIYDGTPSVYIFQSSGAHALLASTLLAHSNIPGGAFSNPQSAAFNCKTNEVILLGKVRERAAIARIRCP